MKNSINSTNNSTSKKDRPLLSICIPTYNRLSSLKITIDLLLRQDSTKFEIVVLDNCSTDGTYEYLQGCNDKRLKIFRNETNIGGIKNGIKVLLQATGEFELYLLDKDFVDCKNLNDFMEFLENNKNLALGWCEILTLDDWEKKQEKGENILLSKTQDKLIKFGYASKHPSGVFFRTQLYKKDELALSVLNVDDNALFAFYLDLICAQICLKGDGALYNKKFFIKEDWKTAGVNKSLTYFNSSVFFLPKNRIAQYKTYLEHLDTLPISKECKLRVARHIVENAIYAVSFGYKRFMEHKEQCYHYNIKPKHISVFSCVFNALAFYPALLDCKLNITKKQKNQLFFRAYKGALHRGVIIKIKRRLKKIKWLDKLYKLYKSRKFTPPHYTTALKG